MYTYELSDNLAETFELAETESEWWDTYFAQYDGPRQNIPMPENVSPLLFPPSMR